MSDRVIHAVAASSDAPGVQPGEGGPQPTLPLHLFADAPDFSASRYRIERVNGTTARAWFGAFHYLGDPSSASDHWGVFAPDLLAVVSIGLPNNVYGVARKYGLEEVPGNREVSRMAKHPTSRAVTSRVMWLVVRRVCELNGWAWVYSYADTGQGHHGGIYQALGGVYVGMSPARTGWRHTDGTMLHPLTAVSLFGSQSTVTMTAHGYTKAPGAITAKHVYILPVGPRTAEIKELLRPFALPYPKRGSVPA